MNFRTLVLAASFCFVTAGCSSHYIRSTPQGLKAVLVNAGARQVRFAHSLDGFKLHPAGKKGIRRWEIDLPAGTEFSYFYIVDGRLFVPPCRFKEADDFGNENCIYVPDR